MLLMLDIPFMFLTLGFGDGGCGRRVIGDFRVFFCSIPLHASHMHFPYAPLCYSAPAQKRGFRDLALVRCKYSNLEAVSDSEELNTAINDLQPLSLPR